MKTTKVTKSHQCGWLNRVLAWQQSNRQLLTWGIYGLVFTSFWYISYFRLDPDFGWHLKAGQLIISSHHIALFDPYTYTAEGFRWINHEWLHDALIGALYGSIGYLGLAIIFAGLWASALRLASRRNVIFVIVLAATSLMPFVGIRPVIWTILGFGILERLLAKPRLTKYIPILFLAWANLHGGFILGLLVLLLHQLFGRQRHLWPIISLCGLITLINPYGFQIYTEITRTIFDTALRGQIDEWKSLLFVRPSATLYLIVFVGFYLIETNHYVKKALSIPGLLFAMSLSSMRHWPIFVIGSLRYLEVYTLNIYHKLKDAKLNRTCQKLLGGLVILLTAGFLYVAYSYHDIPDDRFNYPSLAVDYLKTQPCSGNLFNAYNFGGYLIWKLPDSKVYIDGRMPSWEHDGQKYFDDYQRFFRDPNWRQSEVKKHNIRCLLVETDALANSKPGKPDNHFSLDFLAGEGWHKIDSASTNKYTLLTR